MLKELSLNIPLLEALEQMSGYDRFMKQLVTKTKGATFEDVGGLHHCSAVTPKSLAQKRGDPSAFTIPCNIGSSRFTRALCDLGANINLMSLAIFKQLGLSPPEPTTMRLLMADRTVKTCGHFF